MRAGCARCRGNCSRRSGPKREKAQADLAALLAASRTAVAERRGRLPKPEFQPDLPVNERRADIAELIAKHQVVIVCGETGSGKTTQLPKICLDLGLGARGLIGHTQPRRLAARSVATRLAQELKTQVGAGVGYKIRFHDKSTADSWVKLMTDGILLAESQSDPLSERLRHDHHRRGARAQPEHRFPARLPEAVAAPAPGSEADHHLGDDRCRAFFAAFQRDGSRPGDRGVGPALSGRGALPAGRRSGKEGRRARPVRRHRRCGRRS